MLRKHPRIPRPQRQRGVALFIVIIFVMLSMLLALWASRTAWFNELVVGNDADYQRAFEAAQALVQDAELDIRGETPDGALCNTSKCRAFNAAVLQFPTEAKEINPLITTLAAETSLCKDGLCSRRTGRQDFWSYTSTTSPAPSDLTAGEVTLETLTAKGIAARYGDFTSAAVGTSSKPANPILADRGDPGPGAGGWYWIEVMPYSDKAQSANVVIADNNNQLALNLDVYVIYRITAIAYGRKPGTLAVIQESYARQRRKD